MSATITPASAESSSSSVAYRLSHSVVPTFYDLLLIPHFDSFTFDGHVSIHLNVTESSNEISMHSLDLTIQKVLVYDHHHTAIPVKSFHLDESNFHRLNILLDSTLKAGEHYTVDINYKGILNDKLAGFYRSSYTDNEGTKKYLAVTQFEAADCRRAVPCWDEPCFKARWRVAMLVEKQYTALSNMPVKERTTLTHDSNAVLADKSQYEHIHAYHTLIQRGISAWTSSHVFYEYYDSPVMSSYLLAFCVGEFDYLSAMTKPDSSINAPAVEVRVYTTPGRTNLGHFSLDVAVRCLEFYNRWFGIPYPLPKVDLIAIPDFAAGAMENWGLITYREQALLIDKRNSSALIKQRCCRTVCHELAHMWFGNLVTMDWWNYLWLNEGFARWTEHLATEELFPSWDIFTQFGQDTYALAQNLDALESSHPIEVVVKTSDEANEIFDTISYAKGASCIRMLEDAIGAEHFQKGIRIYMHKFAYKNTATTDLWDALTEATDHKVNVRELMHLWVSMDGYPVVNIDEVKTEDGARTFSFKQQRYFSSGKIEDEKQRNDSNSWNIPLTVALFKTTAAGIDGAHPHLQRIILRGTSGSFKITVPQSHKDSVIKFNHRHTSFVRVQYSSALFKPLTAVVPSLPASDRLGLARDAFALAAAGRVAISDALNVVKQYAAETDYSVISAITQSLQALITLHSGEAYFPVLQKFVSKLFRSVYHQVGWDVSEKDAHLTALLRTTVVQIMTAANDAETVSEATRRLNLFVSDEKKSAIPADLRTPIYGVAQKSLGSVGREILLKIYRKADMAEEKSRILATLGHIDGNAADAEQLINSAIQFLFSDEVRTGDVHFAMSSIASTKVGQQIIWKYLQDNWDKILAKFSKMGFVLGYVLQGALSHFSSHESADEIHKFFATHTCPVERNVRQIEESIRARANRLQREREPLAQWLNAQTL